MPYSPAGGRVMFYRVFLADLRGHKRPDGVDVRLVDEACAGVDEESAEAELLGKAQLLDGQEPLEVLLLVDDQADVAILDALDRGRRHVEAGGVDLARLQVRGLHHRRDCRGEVAVVSEDRLDVRM